MFLPKDAMVKAVAKDREVDWFPRAVTTAALNLMRADSLTGWVSQP